MKKQEEEGWGAKVIDRMAKDLKDAFPENWPDFEIVQRAVAQLEFRYTERYCDQKGFRNMNNEMENK